MKRALPALTLASIIIFAATTEALAERGPCCRRGPRCQSGYSAQMDQPPRMYDAATVQTIQGEVLSVDQVASRGRRGAGVHLTVKTESGTLPVHLGPKWYLRDQALVLKPGDRISVTGSKVDFKGEPAVIAKEVTRDGSALSLRDDTGRPVWAGSKRRRVD